MDKKLQAILPLPESSGAPPDGTAPDLARLVLNPRSIGAALYAMTATLAAAGLTMEALWAFRGHDWVMGLSPKFIMHFENNVPTWFSTMLLSACAGLLALLAFVHARRREPLSRFFAIFASLFVALSLDEAASFHEILHKPLHRLLETDGFLHFAWVIPASVFTAAVGAWSWKYLMLLPGATRRAFLRAGAVFCAGSIGMEMVSAKYLTLAGKQDLPSHGGIFYYGLLTVIEESMEMVGIILFLLALLEYFALIAGRVVLEVDPEKAGGTPSTAPGR